jgi:hypothetical protein
MEVLVALAGSAGKVVGREELLSAVWPGVVVSDEVLTQAVIKLRKALGDTAKKPEYIETIPKRGYRLIAEVRLPAIRRTAADRPSSSRPCRASLADPAVVARRGHCRRGGVARLARRRSAAPGAGIGLGRIADGRDQPFRQSATPGGSADRAA